jgi:hypothetical protein
MLVQMMEYRQPGGALEGGQVPGLPPRRPGAAHDPPQPGGPAPGPAHQVGDLGDVLVLLDGAVQVHRGLPGGGGQQPDRLLIGFGDGPAAGEQHPAPRRGQGQQVADQFVAGADPVDADQQLRPHAGGDLPDRRGQHREVVGEGVRAGVAWAQQHRQALGGIGAPGPQRVEAVPGLERGSGAFLMGQQRDVVHAGRPQRDRHRHRDQRHPAVNQRELPLPAQRPAER